RHTSFASAWISPVIDDTIEIEILDKDVRTDTYRSSGAGGQHVNKTDSAVRLTHLPTGIAVAVQSERSQHQNRAQAWSLLRARLYELELKKREEAADAVNATKTDIGFGHQIRSYVLHPYQMVKDLRTGVETSQTEGVLDGDLDRFLEASLAARIKGKDMAAEGNAWGSKASEESGAAAGAKRRLVRGHHRRILRGARPGVEEAGHRLEAAVAADDGEVGAGEEERRLGGAARLPAIADVAAMRI